MVTLYVLIMLTTLIGPYSGEVYVESPKIIAQYADPYDCEAMKAVLTGSTPAHTELACVKAER